MRWNIRGRDPKTGDVVRTSIEAPTLAEAEQIAQYNGMVLIEEDRAENARRPATLSYPSAGGLPAAPAVPEAAPEGKYDAIERAARGLTVVSVVVGVVGLIWVAWPLVRVGIVYARDAAPPVPAWQLVLAALVESLSGFFALLAAAAARVLAGIALMVRDLAERRQDK
jgi:hypothetical protein